MLRVMRFASVRRLSAAAAVFCVCSVAFAEEPSPGPDDVAYTVVGTEKTYYQTLDLLFAKITNDTKVVVFKDCPFSSAVSLTNAVEFSSESPGGSIIELSAGAGFQILENSSLKVSDQLAGRFFNAYGNPIDGGPEVEGKEVEIGGPSVNPVRRKQPSELIATGIAGIDLNNTLVSGQKIPFFADPDQPFNEVMAMVAMRAKCDKIILGGMGMTNDDYYFFRNTYSWEHYKTKTVVLYLEAGDNEIKLSNDGSYSFNNRVTYAPNIGDIQVNPF